MPALPCSPPRWSARWRWLPCTSPMPKRRRPRRRTRCRPSLRSGHAFGAGRSPPPISPSTCKVLASDEFEGRAPGSAGEEKTVDYLRSAVRAPRPAAGQRRQLLPDRADGARPRPTRRTDAHARRRRASRATLKFGSDMVIGTRTGKTEVKVDGSELVFVGYGVNAPEQNWNDYAGVDVKGKTVVMLVNDPGFHGQRSEAVRRQADDLLRPLDLQVRGSRAPGRRGGADHPRQRRRRPTAGTW